FGGSIGTTVPMSPTLDLIPFGGASYEMDHFTSSIGGASDSGDNNTTLIQLGAGFVFNKVLTILPSVALPTESGSKPTWSISFGYNFGTAAKSSSGEKWRARPPCFLLYGRMRRTTTRPIGLAVPLFPLLLLFAVVAFLAGCDRGPSADEANRADTEFTL